MLKSTYIICCWWARFGRVTQAELLSRRKVLLILTVLLGVLGERRKGNSLLMMEHLKFSRTFEPQQKDV